MANISDKFGRPSNRNGYAAATTVSDARAPGVQVLQTASTASFDEDAPAFFITYRKAIDPVTGEETIIDKTGWKAIVNSDNNSFINLTIAPGYIDNGNQIGDYVEAVPSSYWGNELVTGLEVSHNPDGTLKETEVVAAIDRAPSDSIDGDKLKPATVTSDKLDWESIPRAILRYPTGGSSAGAVTSAGSSGAFSFPQANLQGGMTSPSNGVIEVPESGTYSIVLAVRVQDGPTNNTRREWIEVFSVGSWSRVTAQSVDTPTTNNRGSTHSAIVHIPAGGQVRGVYAVGSAGALRYAADGSTTLNEFSLSAVRVA